MADNPIYYPPVPYTAHFHSGIKNGTVVIISGGVLPEAERFSMNFKCGSTYEDDIAFHFNPRFDEGLVVCNTRESNNWGKREVNSEVPFHRGQQFGIEILITSNEYKVSVSGRHFMGFTHRIPLHRVNAVILMGGIKLTKIEIQSQGVGFHHHYFPSGQIQNSVPFSTGLHNGVSDGSVVIVRGDVQPLADRFSLNFQCGSTDKDDIAFHFNPRFDEGLVLCNTRESDNWGDKEINGEVPFKREHAFEIRVRVTNNGYNVSVNGHHYLGYNHRIPLQRVNTLAVMDCVALSNVETQGQGGGCHHYYFQNGKLQNSVPFSTDFLRGVIDGSVVTVRGSVPPSADTFSINFQCGRAEIDDIAFHFNPRFNEGLVICNTKEQENWGEEESKSEMPFQRGKLFEIQIQVTKCEYKVSVNGRHHMEYYHRIPLNRISTLAIKGDVKLTSVEIHTPGGGC
ncbi:galectin-8-like [Dendrobates tinctorius]|uniref:galectin-8-like n=1 Tax=Dendrobates tinctorius TaxID=92724 RepID=UPI003CCA55AC